MSVTTLRRAVLAGLVLSIAAPAGAQTLKSGVWWNPDESGWGLFVVDQGNAMGSVWFTHDSDGEPVWFLAPTTPQADGSQRGSLHRFTGVPLAQIQGQASDPGTVIGETRMQFSGANALSFSYTVNGQTRTRELKRFDFGGQDIVCRASTGPRIDAQNFSDMWWNPSSSGWGLHISHVGENLYFSWYTYDSDREPVYYIGETRRQADGSYAGELFRSKDGTPFQLIDGAPANAGTDRVGSTRLRFSSGTQASFEYTIGNVTQSKSIERFVFGSTPGVCSLEAYPTGTGNPGGSADDCYPAYSVGDVRQVRFDEGQPGAGTRTERIVGSASFEGQNALVEEISGQTSAGTGVYARNYVQNGSGTLVSFGAEAFNPGSGALISRSVNDPIRIERQRAFTVGEVDELSWTVRSSASGIATTEQLRDKVTLVAREQVTVAAGTFSACKFAVETDLDSTVNVQGVSVSTRVRRTGFRWTSPQFGLLKMQDQGTSEVTTMGFTQRTDLQGSQELLSATVGGQSTP